MAVLKNCKLWLGGYDLTADFNQVAVTQDVPVLDTTTFGSVLAKTVEAGLLSVALDAKLFWAADSAPPIKVDDVIAAALAQSSVPISVAPQNAGVLGERGYTFLARLARYQRGGQVGAHYLGDLRAEAQNASLVRGLVLHNGAESSSGNATGYQLGLLASGKTCYAALHVLASSGGTLTVKVQSDDAGGFGSPTDRITFTAATAIGSEWKTLAGPVATDTYWRANWTLSAGTATFVLVVGIL
jgi:hypothetical protein